jgi:hypothetical protein
VNVTSELVLRRVGPVVDPTRDAIEEGLSRLDAALKALGVGRGDPWLDAHLVRAVARKRLETAAPSTGWPWSVDSAVANSGIHLSTLGANVRVARGDVLRVPAPGHSRTRRAFWSQGAAVQLSMFGDVDAASGRLNLLLLWKPCADGSVVLTVAVPAGVWPFHGREKLIGCIPIEDVVVDGVFEVPADDGDDLVAELHEDELGEDGQ